LLKEPGEKGLDGVPVDYEENVDPLVANPLDDIVAVSTVDRFRVLGAGGVDISHFRDKVERYEPHTGRAFECAFDIPFDMSVAADD
jgi:hypothetical protein